MRQRFEGLWKRFRTPDRFVKHNFLLVFLLGMGASVLGSGFTVLVWGCFAWNLFGWALGRLPAQLAKHERRFCWLIAAYPVAVLLTSLTSQNSFSSDWFHKIMPLLIFASPAILLKRFAGLPAIRYKRLHVMGAIVGTGLSVAFAVATQVFAEFQPEGAAGNSYPFAMAALIGGTFAALALPPRHPFSIMGMIAFFLAVIAVLLSESRAVMACLPFVLLIVAWRHHWRFGSLVTGRAALAMLAVAAVALLPFTSVVSTRIELVSVELNRYYAENDTTSSMGKRMAMWKGGWSLALDAPVLGYGIQNRATAMTESLRRTSASELFKLGHFHNFILTAMIDGGIVVVLGLFATLLAPLYYAFAVRQPGGDRARLAMALSLAAIYGIGGLSALTFGQDILDAMFVYFACLLIFANGARGRKHSMLALHKARFRDNALS